MGAISDTSLILAELGRGDPTAADRLMPLVYSELRGLAERYLQRERTDHTLQATALVHEAYLRLVDQSRVDWKSRAHFFAVAAEMIRRVLVDHARRHRAAKRGGTVRRVGLDERLGSEDHDRIDLLALDEALDELATLNDRHRRVVELRFFGGLTVEESAHVLDVSPETVRADWRMARAWLHDRINR